MNLFSYMLIFFFFFFFFPLHLANALSFNFLQFQRYDHTLMLEGDAYVSNRAIQLIGLPLTRSVGRATYAHPVRLWDPTTPTHSDFTTNFTFVIKSPYNHYGDGFAFFISPFSSLLPPRSEDGFLGLVKSPTSNPFYKDPINTIVAVEFDTYANPWDPDYKHVGIDVNSIVSEVNVSWRSDEAFGKVGNVRISYNASQKNLSVFFTYDNNDNNIYGRIIPNLSFGVDLKKTLPECVRVGFTGASGSYKESYSILSWGFSSSFQERECGDEMGTSVARKGNKMMIGMLVSLCLVVCFGALIGGFTKIRRKRVGKRRKREGIKDVDLLEGFMDDVLRGGIGPKSFSYQELVCATCNFSEEGKLGQGGFGGVYKGFFCDTNLHVAVKRISRGSKQGRKEFISEVKIISRLRHRNLVKLIGWCNEKDELLLVYEIMPNGSLDSHLFGKKKLLTWAVRYKIALGLASSLLYLHEGWEQCVLHRDIKSSNVMLDLEFNAKLGDFGLARFVDHKQGLQTTAVAGTMSYMAPECFVNGKASRESDVFSFGVVALEIACGRRPVELNAEKEKLVEWVWELYGRGELLDARDKRLGKEFDEKEMECLMVVGLWCVHPDPNARPTMKQAIQVLNFERRLPDLPKKMPIPVYCVPSSTVSGQFLETLSSYALGR